MAAKQNQVTASVSQRRRAIHMGLKQYLQGDDLLNAMCIWQQDYARLPKFAITNFVRRITDETRQDNMRAAIHLSVTSSLMLDEDNLGPDPFPDMRRYLTERVGAAEAEEMLGGGSSLLDDGAEQTDSVKVFELLMQTLLEKINRVNPNAGRELRATLLRTLADMSLNDTTLEAATSWSQLKTKHLRAQLEPLELQELLHAVYITSCDLLGPVRTDRLLTESLEIAEASAAGSNFSPRELL